MTSQLPVIKAVAEPVYFPPEADFSFTAFRSSGMLVAGAAGSINATETSASATGLPLASFTVTANALSPVVSVPGATSTMSSFADPAFGRPFFPCTAWAVGVRTSIVAVTMNTCYVRRGNSISGYYGSKHFRAFPHWMPSHPNSEDLATTTLVAQIVEKNVDAERITIGRKLVEELRIVALTLEGIRHVGVVRHHRDDPLMFVSYGPEVDDR